MGHNHQRLLQITNQKIFMRKGLRTRLMINTVPTPTQLLPVYGEVEGNDVEGSRLARR